MKSAATRRPSSLANSKLIVRSTKDAKVVQIVRATESARLGVVELEKRSSFTSAAVR